MLTSAETCRKIKAVLLTAILAMAEVRRVESRVTKALMPGPNSKDQMNDVAEQKGEIWSKPYLQEQVKRVGEEMKVIMADRNSQEQAKHVIEQVLCCTFFN